MKIIKICFIGMISIAQSTKTMIIMQSNDSLDSLPQPPVAQSNTFYGSLQDITEILYSKDSQIQTKLSKTSFKKNNSFSSSFTKHFTRYFCCYNSTERCDCNYTLHQDPKDS